TPKATSSASAACPHSPCGIKRHGPDTGSVAVVTIHRQSRWLGGRPFPTITYVSRGTATVLFTDLVGSTDLRGRLGEEAAEQLRRTHDRLLAQAVESCGGQVVKGLGDGIMAAFTGAADAVAAAVTIQQAVDRLNREGKTPSPLEVRVGLSAGDVTSEEGD